MEYAPAQPVDGDQVKNNKVTLEPQSPGRSLISANEITGWSQDKAERQASAV